MADRMEKEFQKWCREDWGKWSSPVEWAMGGDAGFADEVFCVEGVLTPVEFKTGVVVDKLGVLKHSSIRPDQYAWHRNLAAAGGVSLFVFGVRRDSGPVPFDVYWSRIRYLDGNPDNLLTIDKQVWRADSFKGLLNDL